MPTISKFKINGTIYDIAGADRLPKTGGTLTGDVTIKKDTPNLLFQNAAGTMTSGLGLDTTNTNFVLTGPSGSALYLGGLDNDHPYYFDYTSSLSYPVLTGDRTPYIVSKYSSGYSWYRVWSDNFVEQGGVAAITSGYGPVALLIPFASTNYSVIANLTFLTGTMTYTNADIVATDSLTTTSFRILGSDNQDGAVTANAMWVARGYK